MPTTGFRGKRYLLGFLLAAALPAWAIDFNELAMRGEKAMNKGQYDTAIGLFEKIAKEGATYESIYAIKFNLAWCYYQKGYFEKALPLLEDLSGARAPSPSMKQNALFLLAESHTRLAAAQTGKEKEKERKKNLQKAIGLQTEYINSFSKTVEYPYAIYGRAYAYYLSEEYAKAKSDLDFVLAKYGNTPLGGSALFLLASLYSQQGLDQIKAGKKTEAQAFMEKARQIFDKLSKTDINLALANDSNYSLAETWFDAELYPQAIQYYRNVRPKADVLKDLRGRIDACNARIAADIAKNLDIKALQGELGRLQGQYAGVQDLPDLMITAYFRIADAFFRMKRYDEAITVCKHIMKHAKGEQYNQAAFLVINGWIAQKNVDAAAAEYEDYKSKAGADRPAAERTALQLGQLYFVRNDVTNAIKYFTESAEMFPNAKGAEEAVYFKAACEFNLNLTDSLAETIEYYMEKFPKGHFLANLLYFKAINLAGAGQYEEALQSIDELLARFPSGTESFETVDEAVYQKGVYLTQLKKLKEAIKLYEDFQKRYKESRLKPFALYQMSVAYNDNGQLDKSVAVLQQVAREYRNMEIAPDSLFRIGVMYYLTNDFVRMSHAFEQLTSEFPNSPRNVDAYFFLGYVAKEKLNEYDAAGDYLWRSLELDPAQERAPEIVFLIAQALNEKAQRMGSPIVLSAEMREVYRQSMLESAAACETLLKNYAASDQALSAIAGISDALHSLVRTKMMTAENAMQYFNAAIARHADNPGLQAQLIFSQGMFLVKNGEKEKALAVFKKAFATDPNVRLSSQMLLDYADACKEANALDEARGIYQRVLIEYASDPNAVAPATYGLADILFRQGKDTEAEQGFMAVLKQFPWYEKGKQGKVMIAQTRERKKDYEAAERMYVEVATQERAPETRISATLGAVRCQLALARQFEKQGNKAKAQEKFKAADGSASRIIVMYEAYPQFVAEALWHKGQSFEMIQNYDQARLQYERLVKEYAQYPWAKQAGERLKALPAATPPPAAGK